MIRTPLPVRPVRAVVLAVILGLVPAFVVAQTKPAPTAASKIDINSASQSDLESLPGVGAATAKKIIAGRPYSAVGDLAKAGVPAATITKITPLVIVGPATGAPKSTPKTPPPSPPANAATSATTAKTTAGAKVDLNSASEADLEALPHVGPATAKKIIAGRPYSAVGDLAKAGVPAATITALTPLVTVGTPAAPASTPKPAPPSTSSTTTTGTPQVPPVKGMVWVNLSTRVYHMEGDRYYGNTKNGKFMTEADAIKAGYHKAK